ncbi:MAG: recombinase [Deltaproteobacteria bacterium RBG_16_49_23]|nr:MAG: recombinase [Deltaproteobacteria bacterium RBG_16_49_23]
MKSYEQYEKECKKIRRENEKLLLDFGRWLLDKNLSQRTKNKHLSNVDFYINDYLLYEDAIKATDGSSRIGMFLGYWFIRKAMWASKTSIKESAASLKQFYQFMLERGKLSTESFDRLKERIKGDMPEWLATLERYDDPDIEDPEEIWKI